MIVEACKSGDVIINFNELDYLKPLDCNETGEVLVHPMIQEVSTFLMKENQIPEHLHLVLYKYTNIEGENLDTYEFNLKNYRISATSKNVIDKYFEYAINFKKDNKSFRETYPEAFV